jgi:hypothetical protein
MDANFGLQAAAWCDVAVAQPGSVRLRHRLYKWKAKIACGEGRPANLVGIPTLEMSEGSP